LNIYIYSFLFVSQLFTQNVLSIFVGSEILIKKSKTSYSVNTVGTNFGLFIPINLNSVNSTFKVSASYHGATINGVDGNSKYLSATNEILVGKTIKFDNSKFEILPQFGIGMTLETVYKKFGDGAVFDIVFYDLSIIINYQFQNYKIGMLLNYENGFYTSHNNYIANDRFKINLIFSI
jgi:hypothetical protein